MTLRSLFAWMLGHPPAPPFTITLKGRSSFDTKAFADRLAELVRDR